MSVLRELKLDELIYSRKEQWREDCVAMIAGRVVYQGSKLSLVNMYKDTGLWEILFNLLFHNDFCYIYKGKIGKIVW